MSNHLSIRDTFYYEALAQKNGHCLIGGVDEAGRGPLAGPVVAAAVILPTHAELNGVRDSKQMTPRAREEAFQVIQQQAVATGIGVVSHRHIDKVNILKASLEAMKQAVLALDPQPEFLLVDGIYRVPLPLPQRTLKRGDQRSKSISAASVLAKVYRDRIMCSYHKIYPVYAFDKHKGYGTRRHLAALRKHGASPFHRKSFKGVLSFDKGKT